MHTQKIRVLLADDHCLVRQGLTALLQGESDIQIVGEAENGRVAVELAKKLKPDVIIMDLSMPILNGAEATRQILKIAPATKVVMLSAYSNIGHVLRAMEAGVSGYILKYGPVEDVILAVRYAFRGNALFSPIVSKMLRDHARAESRHPSSRKKGRSNIHLTPREAQVLQLIAEGFSNRKISDELGVSMKSIDKYRQHVMDKVNIHNAAALTKFAISYYYTFVA